MTLRITSTIHANGNGGMPWLAPELMQESRNPLGLTDEIIAQVVPQQAVVLLPNTDLAYPVELTLNHPDDIDADLF
jgi:hypothetical protein